MTLLKRAASLVAVSALAIFFGCWAAAAAVADDGDSGGVGLVVTVGTADATGPADVPTSGGALVDTGSPPSTDDSATPSAPAAVPSAKPGTSAPEFGGIVYLSGLTSKAVWSGDILQSAAELQFTIRNISTEKFDSSARFWVQTTIGNKVGSTPVAAIANLAAGETRVIRATVTGLGQWSVLHAYVDYTPPASVLGVALTPSQRDCFIFVPPIAVGGAGALGAVALIAGNALPVGRLLRFRFGFTR